MNSIDIYSAHLKIKHDHNGNVRYTKLESGKYFFSSPQNPIIFCLWLAGVLDFYFNQIKKKNSCWQLAIRN